MVGRPRKFDEHKALTAAMEVFWRQGYESTSCDDLLSAMGINSGSMYSVFGDKRSLFEKAFDLYEQTVVMRAFVLLNRKDSPLENVRELLSLLGQLAADGNCRGCLVGNTVVERFQEDDPFGNRARKILEDMRLLIEKNLRAAKRSGKLEKDKNPKDLAAFLINTAQGLAILSRSGADKNTIDGVVRTALEVIPLKK